jgi:hypothetical protein
MIGPSRADNQRVAMLNHLIAAYNGLLCSVLVCLVSAGVRLDFR